MLGKSLLDLASCKNASKDFILRLSRFGRKLAMQLIYVPLTRTSAAGLQLDDALTLEANFRKVEAGQPDFLIPLEIGKQGDLAGAYLSRTAAEVRLYELEQTEKELLLG